MPLLNYLGQASLFLACLYAAYWLLFRNEAFHQLNRALLLLIIAGTLSLPLIPAPGLFERAPITGPATTDWVVFGPAGSFASGPFFSEEGIAAESSMPAMETGDSLSLGWWLTLAYFTGLIILAGRLAFQLFLILRLLKRSHWEKQESGWLVTSADLHTPFSFWNIIFLPAGYATSPQRIYILKHERVHQRQWHSADLLLAELFCIVFWFHPAAWRLNRALRAQLEHIADEAVLNSCVNRKGYQYSLLSLAAGNTPFRLANQFNQSLIKTRIVMMNAKKSPAHHQLKYLAVLPLFFLLVLAFNDARAQVTEVKPAKQAGEVVEVNPEGVAASETAISVGAVSGSGSASAGTGTANAAKGGVAVGSASSSSVGAGRSVTSVASMNQSTPYESVFAAIGAEFPVERLPQMKKDLEEQGILLDIEELDYNSDKLITRLKLSVRTTDGKMHGNGYSYNDGQPIDEPVIFYVRRDEANYGFGIFTGKMNENVPAEVRNVIGRMKNGYFVGKIITE